MFEKHRLSEAKFKVTINPKAGLVTMPDGNMYRGGKELLLPYEHLIRLNPSLIVGNYKGTGKPFIEIDTEGFVLRGWISPKPRSDGRVIDVAYPLKHSIDYPELLYSVRSLGNLAGVGRVYLAGGKPKWINSLTVTHLEVPQVREKFEHIGRCLQAVVDSDISEDFVWMNDDILFLNPVEEIPVFARLKALKPFVKSLHNNFASNDHAKFYSGMYSQMKILQEWGYDPETYPMADTHHPLMVNKTKLRDLLERLRTDYPKHPLGHFKALYNAGAELTPIPDPKRKGHRLSTTTEDYFSFSEETWVKEGWEARLSFRRKSPYER